MDKLARCYHQSIDRLIDYLPDGTLKVSPPQRDKVDLSAAVVFFSYTLPRRREEVAVCRWSVKARLGMGKSAFSTWLREVLLMSQIRKFGLFDRLVPSGREGSASGWLADQLECRAFGAVS